MLTVSVTPDMFRRAAALAGIEQPQHIAGQEKYENITLHSAVWAVLSVAVRDGLEHLESLAKSGVNLAVDLEESVVAAGRPVSHE